MGKDFVSSESRSSQLSGWANRTTKTAEEFPDESEVLYIRKELDGEILPAEVVPEHTDYGQAYCKLVERGLGNNDRNLPFWK